MLQHLRDFFDNPYALGGAIALGSIVGAYIAAFIIEKILAPLVAKTKTDLDDRIMAALRKPFVASVMLTGFALATELVPMPDKVQRVTVSLLKTIAILVWASGGFKVVAALLETLSRRATETSVVQPRTLPFFEMVGKTLTVGTAVYFAFLAWRIDLTAWLASAGIVGIAVGFAAKDTLANLFSGIFIVADAPYKIGDFIVLDDGVRGQVTSIGLRSTRILTRDDIEITIPNAVIGNSKIVNEAGGPKLHQRMSVIVDAAYGADIDLVHQVLLDATKGIDKVLSDPGPCVRFREFGASGLTHVLYVWIYLPRDRELVLHLLNTAVYKAFNEAGLEIPYSKHDVYIKEQPPLRATGS